MADVLGHAAAVITTQGRLVDRLIFRAKFDHGSPAAVETAVRAYANPDGGLGYAIEPDLRCSESQPIFAEVGLALLHEVGQRAPQLADQVSTYLASRGPAGALLPAIGSEALDHPHAAHWNSPSSLAPNLNPSLGLCGLLHYHGVSNDWVDALSTACLDQLTERMPSEAHTLLGAVRFATHHPDPAVAEPLFERIAESLPNAEFFVAETPVRSYGLTPLHFAPHPDALLRGAFPDAVIEAHLEDLLTRQQADGSWPVAWEPPGAAAVSEWRARVTLDAISVLADYRIISNGT